MKLSLVVIVLLCTWVSMVDGFRRGNDREAGRFDSRIKRAMANGNAGINVVGDRIKRGVAGASLSETERRVDTAEKAADGRIKRRVAADSRTNILMSLCCRKRIPGCNCS